jgi:glutathione S-transferase
VDEPAPAYHRRSRRRGARHPPPDALRRTEIFIKERIPKYLGYFERVLERNARGDRFLVGGRLSYADLSLFQAIAGLDYALPGAMARSKRRYARLHRLHDSVAARARIRAYLASDRRIPFNEHGIFRRYAELDL